MKKQNVSIFNLQKYSAIVNNMKNACTQEVIS